MSDRTDAMSDSELLALARKATPGPWEWDNEDLKLYGNGDLARVIADRGDGEIDYNNLPGEPIIQTDCGHYGPRENDRAYIAAANPAAIIAMHERHRAEVERLTRERDEARTDQAIANNLARAELAKREAAESALAAAQKRCAEIDAAARETQQWLQRGDYYRALVSEPALRAALAGTRESDNAKG